MKALVRAVALGAVLVAGTASAAMAQTSTPAIAGTMFNATTLNLSANGSTHTAPDQAVITLGVQTEAPTAAEAMRLNAQKMNQVIAALKKGGLESRDLQTSNLNLNPQYVYQENLPPKLTGYQASNQVTITVRDLTKLGQAVDASVNAGATNIGGISFGLQNADKAEDAARLDAVKAVQAKADLYAKATGYRVARLVSLSEGGGYQPEAPVQFMAMARGKAAMDSTPVEAGELKVQISINAIFELVK